MNFYMDLSVDVCFHVRIYIRMIFYFASMRACSDFENTLHSLNIPTCALTENTQSETPVLSQTARSKPLSAQRSSIGVNGDTGNTNKAHLPYYICTKHKKISSSNYGETSWCSSSK